MAQITRWVRRRPTAEDTLTEAIRDTVAEDESIDFARKDMILKAAGFDKLRVADVMRPRADIVALDVSATLAEAARLFSESQHSRLPIYRENLDDPQGFVHVRDVMAVMAPGEEGQLRAKPGDRILSRVKREILYVPPSMKLSSLLLKMQSTRIHLALVVDEYGGSDGLVSMEDIVEQIVGEIDDEFDIADDEGDIFGLPDRSFRVSGDTSLERVSEAFGVNLQEAREDSEGPQFDTIGGLIAHEMGHVPRRGEKYVLAGLQFVVLHTRAGAVRWFKVSPATTSEPQA